MENENKYKYSNNKKNAVDKIVNDVDDVSCRETLMRF